ncbi:MAG: lipoyl(octanoyl) transferase, partial [Cytophagaceae bacterium]|nr:lipoyl(octanoyl) transferase [Cytophagaceae bacterium]
MVKNKKVIYKNLGLVEYKDAWDFQTSLFNQVIQTKIENRDLADEDKKQTDNYLIFCQHPHVYTLGKSGSKENLLAQENELKKKQATFFESNRGGDI